MFCRNCGFEILGGTNFCPRCGTPVTPPAYETHEAPQTPNRSKNKCSVKGIVGFGLSLGAITLWYIWYMSLIGLGLGIAGLILSVLGAKETEMNQWKGKGFTTAGSPRVAIMPLMSSAACVSIFIQSGVGIPAARKSFFEMSLSIARRLPIYPEPVYLTP